MLWLTDLERITFAPPRSDASEDSAAASGLVVVSRAAALAELADDDTESQLDTDVLASDVFSREDALLLCDFLTMNWQNNKSIKKIKTLTNSNSQTLYFMLASRHKLGAHTHSYAAGS